jgi:hypothetical protein
MNYFKFKRSCLAQASSIRFASAEARTSWLQSCLKTHLKKMEVPTVSQRRVVQSRLHSINSQRGRILGLNRSTNGGGIFNSPKQHLNEADIRWHYPSKRVGSNYQGFQKGISRGDRGRIGDWNLGMGRARMKNRTFYNNSSDYGWGYFV